MWPITASELKLDLTHLTNQNVSYMCQFTDLYTVRCFLFPNVKMWQFNILFYRDARVIVSALEVIYLYSYCFAEPWFWPQSWMLAASIGLLYVNMLWVCICVLHTLHTFPFEDAGTWIVPSQKMQGNSMTYIQIKCSSGFFCIMLQSRNGIAESVRI